MKHMAVLSEFANSWRKNNQEKKKNSGSRRAGPNLWCLLGLLFQGGRAREERGSTECCSWKLAWLLHRHPSVPWSGFRPLSAFLFQGALSLSYSRCNFSTNGTGIFSPGVSLPVSATLPKHGLEEQGGIQTPRVFSEVAATCPGLQRFHLKEVYSHFTRESILILQQETVFVPFRGQSHFSHCVHLDIESKIMTIK